LNIKTGQFVAPVPREKIVVSCEKEFGQAGIFRGSGRGYEDNPLRNGGQGGWIEVQKILEPAVAIYMASVLIDQQGADVRFGKKFKNIFHI